MNGSERPEDGGSPSGVTDLDSARIAKLVAQLTAQLREPAPVLATLVDALPLMVWTVNAAGAIDYYNRHWFQYSGLDETTSYTAQAWIDAIHPDDRAQCSDAFATGIASGAKFELEYRLRRASDGSYRWHLGRSLPLRDETGSIVKWLGTGIDIHEKTVAQERLNFLAQASKALAESLDAEMTLHRIAHVALPFFADWCQIDVMDDRGRLQTIAVAHHNAAKETRLRSFVGRYQLDPGGPVGPPKVIRSGVAELLEAIPEGAAEAIIPDIKELRIYRDVGYHSTITVPLRMRGRIFGTMIFVLGDDSARRYVPEDVSFAEELGQRAAQAYDNAANFERERETASSLQISLLPASLPVHPAVVLSSEYMPGSDGLLIGGDWYDAFFVTPDVLALSIGDVVGHGAAAATAMAALRYGIRAAALQGAAPAAVLAVADKVIRRERSEYASAIFGYLDLKTSEFTFANAGHPPPMTLDANGSSMIHRFESDAGLGVDSNASFVEHVIYCGPGCVLVLYTDGLTEFDRNTISGEMRLAESMKTLVGEPPEVRAHLLAERVLKRFTHSDDIAILTASIL